MVAVPSVEPSAFGLRAVGQVQQVEEEAHTLQRTSEADLLLGAEIDQFIVTGSTRVSPEFESMLMVGGVGKPRPDTRTWRAKQAAALVLHVRRDEDVPGELVAQLNFADHRPVTDEATVRVDEVVRPRGFAPEGAAPGCSDSSWGVRSGRSMPRRPSAFDNTSEKTPCQLLRHPLGPQMVTPL